MHWKSGSSTITTLILITLGVIIYSGLSIASNEFQALAQNASNASDSANATSLISLDNLNIGLASGSFTSLQNDSDHVMWITSGRWSISADPSQNQTASSSPIIFNATIDMLPTDRPSNHRHRIFDFSLDDGSINSTEETSTLMLNGSASIDTDTALYVDVPISIRIIDKEPIIVSIDTQSNRVIPKWVPGGGLISLWIDATKVDDHFGNTPVYGIVRKG